MMCFSPASRYRVPAQRPHEGSRDPAPSYLDDNRWRIVPLAGSATDPFLRRAKTAVAAVARLRRRVLRPVGPDPLPLPDDSLMVPRHTPAVRSRASHEVGRVAVAHGHRTPSLC